MTDIRETVCASSLDEAAGGEACTVMVGMSRAIDFNDPVEWHHGGGGY